MNNPIWPVFEFRPIPTAFRSSFVRYADGAWLPDDGEYDIAFAGVELGDNSCLYVSLPYQRNIVCSWLTTHWTQKVARHPRENPWHYSLREGTSDWGGNWGRDSHPNTLAGDRGMSFVASRKGCANGRGIKFKPNDPHIVAGLLRDRETKEMFRFARGLTCMYCGIAPAVKCEVAA